MTEEGRQLQQAGRGAGRHAGRRTWGLTRGELLAPRGGLRPCKLDPIADWALHWLLDPPSSQSAGRGRTHPVFTSKLEHCAVRRNQARMTAHIQLDLITAHCKFRLNHQSVGGADHGRDHMTKRAAAASREPAGESN